MVFKRLQVVAEITVSLIMIKAILLFVFVVGLAVVEPHGFLRVPLARTSVHRLPNWGGAQQPFWWDDTGVWCGNQQQNQAFSTCGRCGDAPGNNHAIQGGRYDKQIITGTYTAGQRIPFEVQMDAAHQGQFRFELCPQVSESNTCFTHQLQIHNGNAPIRNGNAMCVGMASTVFRGELQLPAGVRCTRCTLRWTYRTAYPPSPDTCWNPNNAQTFRNCADIRIN